MLHSIYHWNLVNRICVKNTKQIAIYTQRYYGRYYTALPSKPLVIYQFECMTLFHFHITKHIV